MGMNNDIMLVNLGFRSLYHLKQQERSPLTEYLFLIVQTPMPKQCIT